MACTSIFLLHGVARSHNLSCLAPFFNLQPCAEREGKPSEYCFFCFCSRWESNWGHYNIASWQDLLVLLGYQDPDYLNVINEAQFLLLFQLPARSLHACARRPLLQVLAEGPASHVRRHVRAGRRRRRRRRRHRRRRSPKDVVAWKPGFKTRDIS